MLLAMLMVGYGAKHDRETAVFNNEEVEMPVNLTNLPDLQVLGVSTEPKRIQVDLTEQRLYAFEGDRLIFNFIISSGKWGKTPEGVFSIWGKFKYTKMEGGSKTLHTYYYLPNVPYVMFFANEEVAASKGFSIHGTYWHNNFGQPMSHGCINMKTEEAAQLYQWAGSIGTKVIIYGQFDTPQS